MKLIKEADSFLLLELPAVYMATSVADMLDSKLEVINHCTPNWPWSADVEEGRFPARGAAYVHIDHLNHDLKRTEMLRRSGSSQIWMYDESGHFTANVSPRIGQRGLWLTTPWVNRTAIILASFTTNDSFEDIGSSFTLVDITNFTASSKEKKLKPFFSRVLEAMEI